MRSKNTRLVLILTFIYFVSYVTRINYAAVLLEIVASSSLTKETASYAVTGLAVFYGAGQLLSGYLGDIIKPKNIMAAGLILTTFANVILPFTVNNYFLLTVVWCVNGLAQAMMWPPIVKILSSTLDADAYKKACVKISYGSASGTIAVYLLSPLCIRISGWQTVFFIAASLSLVFAVITMIFVPDVGIVKREKKTESASSGKTAFPYVMFVLILVAIALQGALRDGITTWMPSYVSEQFGLENEIAILTCVAMPLFSMLCYEAASFLSRKVIKNELLCAGAIFAVALAASFLLSLFSTGNVIMSVILATIITGTMHGVNVILICILPPLFAKTGRVSFISGILNSFTYVGSAASGYGFAALSESFGWSITIMSWGIIALVATCICFSLAKPWKKYLEE